MSLDRILSPPPTKLLVLMGAVERMENLARRHSGRRVAQGNPYTFTDGNRISSLEALSLEDLEKHGHGRD